MVATLIKKIANDRGMTLIEAMVGLAILGITSIATASLLDHNLKSQRTIERKDHLAIARDLIVSGVSLRRAWEQTLINANALAESTSPTTIMDCLKESAGIPGTQTGRCPSGNFEVYLSEVRDASGTILFNSFGHTPSSEVSVRRRGFRFPSGGSSFVSCGSFIGPGSQGDDNCPFQASLKIQGSCGGAVGCPDPDLSATLEFSYNPGPELSQRMGAINVQSYAVQGLIPGANTGILTLPQACRGLGGVYNPFVSTCTLDDDANLATLPATCGANEFLQRIGVSNQFKCVKRFQTSVSCPVVPGGNNVMNGLNATPEETSCIQVAKANLKCDPGFMSIGVKANGDPDCIRELPSKTPTECETVVLHVPGGGVGFYHATCPNSKKAIGGGGDCGGGAVLRSVPWNIAANQHARNLDESTGWSIACPIALPQVDSYTTATCCTISPNRP